MADCLIKILIADGLQPAPYVASSLNEAAQHEPADGVYTVARTYNTFQTLKLDAHLDRLEDSARCVNIPLRLDRAKLRAALREMIAQSGFGDVRFRITVSRAQPDAVILSLEPFRHNIAQMVAEGIRCAIAPGNARENPAAKSTAWMHQRKDYHPPAGITESLLVSDDGDILEGFGSNFYAILDGELRTAGEGVLGGISRQVVFEIAPDVLSMRKEPVNVRDLANLSEAFITSSSRGIIPVIEIDNVQIGDGKPAPITLELQRRYDAWVDEHLEQF